MRWESPFSAVGRARVKSIAAECVRLSIGAVFAFAGFAKLLEFPLFLSTLNGYVVLPDSLVLPAGVAVVLLETLLGSLMCANLFPRATASLLLSLTILFMAATFANIVAGRTAECGCFGSFMREAAGPVLLLRDFFLLVGCAWIALIHRRRGERGIETD